MLFPFAEVRKHLPQGAKWYCSGANRESELHGLQLLGIPVGVSVDQLGKHAIDTLLRSDRPVMLDSGAFSEVKLRGQKWETVRAISDTEWMRRLALYVRFARALRSKLLCVAPDRVGSQQITLDLLDRYRLELAQIVGEGAELLLPLQVGTLSHEAFYRRAIEVCGLQLSPAMPMRKAATSMEEIVEFLIRMQPKRIHFLGIGPEARKAWDIVRLVRFYSPESEISMDSNGLRAKLGVRRPLTVAETRLRGAEVQRVYGAVESEVFDILGLGLDYTDAIAMPSTWIRTEQLTQIGKALRLSPPEMHSLLSTPDTFLQSICHDTELTWIEHPVVSLELDQAWEDYLHESVRAAVRTAAIVSTFSESMGRATL